MKVITGFIKVLSPRVAGAVALVASALIVACGGNSGSTAVGSSHTTQTIVPEARATPVPTVTSVATAVAGQRVLSFDEIRAMVAAAYNSGIQIPAGMCSLDPMEQEIANNQAVREDYDKSPTDFSPAANGQGILIAEIQKVGDATGSQAFADLQKALEGSLIADLRSIVERRNGTEAAVQNFLAIWRSNWLDRHSSSYDASHCGFSLGNP